MVLINYSLVLRMAMADNIFGTNLTSECKGEKLLESTTKNQPQAELAQLIKLAQSGNLDAFEKLYTLYKRKVYGLAYNLARDHQTAEDLVQDIFLKIFSAINDIDRPELFPAWVYRVALNTCYSHLRREKTYGEKLEVLAPVDEGQADESFDSRPDDLTRAVNEALARLPEKLRTVFLLHEVDGLTHEEIAAVLGCQPGTSKSQLFKARMKLRKILKKKKLLQGGNQ
ncbi:MAG: RNA polymerase sigma factor [Candidatus Aminicenantes bacterium]|nr:RNA polymerase sigma factor [Candidatus Aminicenantes bacterium]